MQTTSKIYVAGHQGMVGSAIIRQLKKRGFNNIVYKTHKEMDLTNQAAVNAFFEKERPEYVVVAAAKVGGIHANNTYPADFIYSNLMVEANTINSAFVHKCKSLLFLGSSCIYPKMAKQPITEDELLTGYLEPTNEAYAVAKIAGIKLCESYNRQHNTDFRSVMPTNLYGINDNFNLDNGHVVPALLRKFHDAKMARSSHVEIWGTGSPCREFLHVDDMASACLHVMNLTKEQYQAMTKPALSHINVGFGSDVSIKQLAETIKKVVGFKGDLIFDTTKPDGTPRKLLDSSKLLSSGWKPTIDLEAGLESTYRWFLEQQGDLRE